MHTVCNEWNYNPEQVFRMPVIDFFAYVNFINAYYARQNAKQQAEIQKMRHGGR